MPVRIDQLPIITNYNPAVDKLLIERGAGGTNYVTSDELFALQKRNVSRAINWLKSPATLETVTQAVIEQQDGRVNYQIHNRYGIPETATSILTNHIADTGDSRRHKEYKFNAVSTTSDEVNFEGTTIWERADAFSENYHILHRLYNPRGGSSVYADTFLECDHIWLPITSRGELSIQFQTADSQAITVQILAYA